MIARISGMKEGLTLFKLIRLGDEGDLSELLNGEIPEDINFVEKQQQIKRLFHNELLYHGERPC
jgi:hypothetical protein